MFNFFQKKNSQELIDLLCVEETVDRSAKANGVGWYARIVRRNNDDVLRRTFDFEKVGRRGCGDVC